MNLSNRPSFRLSIVAAALCITFALAFAAVLAGQQTQTSRIGFPEDWSHRHLVFSSPGTFREAVERGDFDRWSRIANEPRFRFQQMKRAAMGGPASILSSDFLVDRFSRPAPPSRAKIQRDWSVNLGSGAKVGAGQYPAKYSFDPIGTPNCTTDFAAFNTGLAGGASQATIVAYNKLYAGVSPGCGTSGVPAIYWQYNTAYPQGSTTGDGSKIVTSVVLSGDGSQLAFIESNSSNVASLVILKWAANSSLVQMDTSSNNVTTATYASTCRSGSTACMTRIPFGDSHNDTNASPFYDYSHDVLYVGDSSGALHKFQNIFVSGIPSEVTASPWPNAVSTTALTSPVYDPTSTLVFVGDASGFLYSVNLSGTVSKSFQVAVSPGIVDGPLVDGTTEKVYVFVGEDINGSNSGTSPCESSGAGACNGVFQFSASTPLAGAALSESVLGVGTPNAVYDGTFDNLYYTSEGSSNTTPTGNLYWCGGNGSHFPRLAETPVTTGSLATGTSHAIPNGTAYIATTIQSTMTSAAATCSPVTEILNGTTDWIFLSVSSNASLTASGLNKCSGTGVGCVYSFNTTSALAVNTSPVDGLSVAGGSSGIIIDNISASTGASQVYFSTLGNQSCATSGGTGGCAVQASQSALN